MKTANEMLEAAKRYGGLNESDINDYKRAFDEVVKLLQPDEEVILAFAGWGCLRSEENSGYLSNVGVALTNQRLLIGGNASRSVHKKCYVGEYYNISNINAISQRKGFIHNDLIIDTLGADLSISEISIDILNRIAADFTSALQKIKAAQSANTGKIVQQVSAADELKKFKELLDMGVISQQEFDAKKKQLLGL